MAQFGWGPRTIGFVFFYVGLLSAMMQGGLIGPLDPPLWRGTPDAGRPGPDRARPRCSCRCAHDVPLLLVAVTALAVGMGAMQPSINSLISRRAGRDEQGEVLGVAQSVGSLSRVLGPILAGSLFTAFGRSSPFLWGAALVGGRPDRWLVRADRAGAAPAEPGPVG